MAKYPVFTVGSLHRGDVFAEIDPVDARTDARELPLFVVDAVDIGVMGRVELRSHIYGDSEVDTRTDRSFTTSEVWHVGELDAYGDLPGVDRADYTRSAIYHAAQVYCR